MFKTKIQKKTCIKFSVSASFRRDLNDNNDYKKFDNIENKITKLNNNENFKNSSRNLPLNEISDLQTKLPLFPPPATPFPFQKPNINIFEKKVILLSNFFINIENQFYTFLYISIFNTKLWNKFSFAF